jgi:hypothetical protein
VIDELDSYRVFFTFIIKGTVCVELLSSRYEADTSMRICLFEFRDLFHRFQCYDQFSRAGSVFHLTLKFIRSFCGIEPDESIHVVDKDGSPCGPRHHLVYISDNQLNTSASIAAFSIIRGARVICFTRSRQGFL